MVAQFRGKAIFDCEIVRLFELEKTNVVGEEIEKFNLYFVLM